MWGFITHVVVGRCIFAGLDLHERHGGHVLCCLGLGLDVPSKSVPIEMPLPNGLALSKIKFNACFFYVNFFRTSTSGHTRLNKLSAFIN